MKYLLSVIAVLFLISTDPILLVAQDDDHIYMIFKKHNDAVKAIAFSNDGKYLASGGEDKAIYIWNYLTGEVVYSIPDNYYPPGYLQFARDNKLLASSGPDVKIIDYDGNLIGAFGGYTTHIWSFDYNAGSDRLIAGSYSKNVNIWKFSSRGLEANLEGHDKSVLAVCFSPDGKYAVTGSLDRTVRVWDADSSKELKKLERHSDNILAVKFHPSGKYFASASLDKTIRLWDIDSGKVVKSYIGHNKGVLDVDFSPDGYYLASASADNTVILWEVYTGNKLYSFVDHQGPVNAVRFSTDGRYLASASSDKTVILWTLSKDIFADYYYKREIDDVVGMSDLYGPKRKGESKEQYAEREEKARLELEKLYNKYYEMYLEQRQLQHFRE